jgi:predicted anti-sigma-YlaC factor YlaD
MTGSKICDQIADQLPEFLAGRVSEADEERIRKHLESCADCRKRANAVSLLQQTPVPRPDPDRWDDFVDGVVDAADRRHRRERMVQTALAVIAALILIGVLVYFAAF